MIFLFTDFGLEGPYIGQMTARIYRHAPAVPVAMLMADAPQCNPRAAAYLLAAVSGEMQVGDVLVGVVDPGVGTSQRRSVVAEIDGGYYVGPDNGLFAIVARRATQAATLREIVWQPPALSSSFHGRDLFAPIGAWLAAGHDVSNKLGPPEAWPRQSFPDDVAEIIYIDRFGNAMTGLRAAAIEPTRALLVAGHELFFAPTFGAVDIGNAFWYVNSMGLVEIAVNQGSAAQRFGLAIGASVRQR